MPAREKAQKVYTGFGIPLMIPYIQAPPGKTRPVRRPRCKQRAFYETFSEKRVRWNFTPSDPVEVARLARALNLTEPAARVLCARGYRDPVEARRFLAPELKDLHDPWALRDMPAAVDRLRRAIEQKEPILLYGDYDADGTSAIVILMKGLELAGGQAFLSRSAPPARRLRHAQRSGGAGRGAPASS